MDDSLPVVNLELNSGVFKIKTPVAIYQITVTPDSTLTKVVEKIVEKEVIRAEAAPPPRTLTQAMDLFYSEITTEMYSEIGKLARQLSLSIKEIPGKYRDMDIQQTGVELEDAKGQLEDIVHMTEKATMDIMDLAESIQDELNKVQDHLGALKDLEFMNIEPIGSDWDEGPSAAAAPPPQQLADTTNQFLNTIIDQEGRLREAITSLPVATQSPGTDEPVPAALPPQVQKVTTYIFDLDVVFQTMYELCTNEAVKDHIKAMRTERNTAFDGPALLKALSDQAPTVTMEDNFFNFPIPAVLKTLFQTAKSEKYKQVLKKMNQTAASIFLEAILPLEGQVQEKEISSDPPLSAPKKTSLPPRAGLPPEKIESLLSLVDQTVNMLEAEKGRLSSITLTSGAPDLGEDFTRVRIEDREQIVNTLEGSRGTIQQIMNHITRILEALSFQDLSGQRIMKIVRLISDVQVQLLSLLVSFGTKIKQKQKESQAVTSTKQTEKMAQAEVDRMMERVAPPPELGGPGAEGRLDQNAVDGMLAELGF